MNSKIYFFCRLAVDLAQPGKYITLRNAKIDMFRGSMRLAVDHWGKVDALEDANFEAKVITGSCRGRATSMARSSMPVTG